MANRGLVRGVVMDTSVAHRAWAIAAGPRARWGVSAQIGATPTPSGIGCGLSSLIFYIYDIRGNVGFFSRHLTSHIAQGLASALSRCDPLAWTPWTYPHHLLWHRSLVVSWHSSLLSPPGPLTGALSPSLEYARSCPLASRLHALIITRRSCFSSRRASEHSRFSMPYSQLPFSWSFPLGKKRRLLGGRGRRFLSVRLSDAVQVLAGERCRSL